MLNVGNGWVAGGFLGLLLIVSQLIIPKNSLRLAQVGSWFHQNRNFYWWKLLVLLDHNFMVTTWHKSFKKFSQGQALFLWIHQIRSFSNHLFCPFEWFFTLTLMPLNTHTGWKPQIYLNIYIGWYVIFCWWLKLQLGIVIDDAKQPKELNPGIVSRWYPHCWLDALFLGG